VGEGSGFAQLGTVPGVNDLGPGRRRRWPWITAIAVVALVGLLVAADRVTAGLAESAVAKRINQQSPFVDSSSKAHVTINGFPFLTQALAGRYDDIRVTGSTLTIDNVNGVNLDAHMHGVHVPLGNAMNRDVRSLPIDHVSATATVPFSEAARLTGIDGLQLSDNHGALHVSLGVSVPAMGDVTASADAGVRVDGNKLAYQVGQIVVNGAPVPDALSSTIQQQMNGALTLPQLPYHLQVTGVHATPAGIQATARADHIVVETD
jgi:LmeA-like phospholipid-binding